MNRAVVNLATRKSAIGSRLARGYSLQIFENSERNGCDIEGIFKLLFNLNPNKKSYSRCKNKLEKIAGVIKCGISNDETPKLQIIFRSCFLSKTIHEGGDCFDEQVVSYTRLDVWPHDGQVSVSSYRALFSIHALQRFIQRTDVDYRDKLETAVNLEGIACLSALSGNYLLGSDTNAYAPSIKFMGAWAVEVTRGEAEIGWPNTSSGDRPEVRILSVSTFLSPDEMSPQVYLQWNGDPRCNFLQMA